MTVCTDNHSNGKHCPMHGFDDSVPAPVGYRWHRVPRANGQTYTSLVPWEATTTPVMPPSGAGVPPVVFLPLELCTNLATDLMDLLVISPDWTAAQQFIDALRRTAE